MAEKKKSLSGDNWLRAFISFADWTLRGPKSQLREGTNAQLRRSTG
jgi:hypothetical protein